jgi:hypothetical protein
LGASSAAAWQLPLQRSLNSLLIPFEFPSDGPRIGFVVKLAQHSEIPAAAAAEFENLGLLYPHFAHRSPLRVPQPLDHFAELNAIVIERVFAPRLDRIIRAETSRWQRGTRALPLDHCLRAGRWLRALLFTNRERDPRTAGTRAEFGHLWSAELSARLERASLVGLPDSLARELEELLAQPLPHCHGPLGAVHSDYAPYNLRGEKDALYVTDFAEMPLGSGDQCAAFFWAWLELIKMHPLLSSRALGRCQAAFHEGFGDKLSTFWQVWGMLRLYSYLPCDGSIAAGPKRWWHRRRVARLTSWLAANVHLL